MSRFIPTVGGAPINLEYVTHFSYGQDCGDPDGAWWVMAHIDSGATGTVATVAEFLDKGEALNFMNEFVGAADRNP